MKTLIFAIAVVMSSTVVAAEPQQQGCSNFFQVGSSTRDFVVACMKVDGIAVRTPDRVLTHQNQYGLSERYYYGRTIFHFTNGRLTAISN